MQRIVAPEQEDAGDPVDVKQQSQKHADVRHRRNALQQRTHQDLQARQRMHQPEHTQKPQQAQHRHVLPAQRQQRDRHDREVEDVVDVAEVIPAPLALRDHLHRDFEHEDDQHQPVERVQPATVGRHRRRECLDAYENPGEQDDAGDEDVKSARIDDATSKSGHADPRWLLTPCTRFRR
jgi:hypothetical protein